MKKYAILFAAIGLLLLGFFAVKKYFVVQAGSDGSYANYSKLADERVEGIDYEIISRDTDSDTAVIAIHGGSIEPGTSELAETVAGDEYDFYTFYGMMTSDNLSLRITSTNFDEPIARNLVEESNRTLSIHGFAGSTELTYVGGRDLDMVDRLKKSLADAGFEVADAPMRLAATDVLNICNDNALKAGAQIEISAAQRLQFFAGLDEEGRKTTTNALTDYSQAVEAALASH